MKILLANPSYKISLDDKYEKYFIRAGSRWPHSGIKRKGTLPHYLPFPFYLAYSAAWLRKEGFSVDVLDCVALDFDEDDFIAYLEKTKPEFILFETTTPTINYDLKLAKKIREKEASSKIIFAGAHSTTFSEKLMEKNRQIDFILRGEYEEILVNLMKAVRAGGVLEEVKGIAFRKDGKVVATKNAPLIEPLDKLPHPARELFPAPWKSSPSIYWDGFCQMRPAIQMHASRGCPYRCDFCLWNQVMYRQGKYRTFSPARVVDEMEESVKKYGAREIYFDDDDFTINKKHVQGICEEIIRRELNVKWSCMGDAINPDEALIELMAESGCIGMKFGVESGSARVLKNLGKPVNLDKVKKIARWCARWGIKTHATFSLGLFGDDSESVRETVDFMRKLDVDTIQLSISTPFPGTEFYRKSEEGGYLRTKNWQLYDGKASEVFSHPALDWETVERLKSAGMRKWILSKIFSPSWVKRQLRYFFRLLNGLGIRFVIGQIFSIAIDEVNAGKCKAGCRPEVPQKFSIL